MAAQDDPRVKPHVRAAAQEVVRTFGITDIGGFATTGHMVDSDHYRGLAIDVMGTVKAQQVANWAVANAQRLSVTYVIWNRQINDVRDGKGWVAYHGASPHTDHVHISFAAVAGAGGPVVGFGPDGTSATAPDNSPQGCLKALFDLFGF